VAPHPGIGTTGYPLSDLSVEVLSLHGFHRDVAGEGVQERDVLLGRVVLVPDVAPDLDLFEQASGLDRGRLIRDLLRRRRRPLSRWLSPIAS
jgi:hypothetical protein